MSSSPAHFHYVCTLEQARELIAGRERFWVSNCGCREERGAHCWRSRMDVCLQFRGSTAASGSGMREITAAEVEAIFREAEQSWLVARPFRRDDDFTVTDGICFCCDDCCSYFTNPEERCDPGESIELTDMDACTHCGICEDYCYFHARTMAEGQLSVNRDMCYGCGLCVASCPELCVALVNRNSPAASGV